MAYLKLERIEKIFGETRVFTEYYRCYCIGGKHVRIMSYEPRNPFTKHCQNNL